MSTKIFFPSTKVLWHQALPWSQMHWKKLMLISRWNHFILPFFLHFNTSNTVSTNRWPIIWNRRPCYKKAVGNSTSATCWWRNIEKKLSLGEQDFQRWILFFFSCIYISNKSLSSVCSIIRVKRIFLVETLSKQKNSWELKVGRAQNWSLLTIQVTNCIGTKTKIKTKAAKTFSSLHSCSWINKASQCITYRFSVFQQD